MKEIIESKISKELNPKYFEVINNSNLHKGHDAYKIGDKGIAETHFLLKIFDDELSNINRIKIHRSIKNILKEEFELGLHSLEINILRQNTSF